MKNVDDRSIIITTENYHIIILYIYERMAEVHRFIKRYGKIDWMNIIIYNAVENCGGASSN